MADRRINANQSHGSGRPKVSSHISRPITYEQRASQSVSLVTDVKSSKTSGTSRHIFKSVSTPLASVQPTTSDNAPSQPVKKILTKKKLTLTFTSLSIIAFVVGAGIGISNLRINKQTTNKVDALAQNDVNGPESQPSQSDLESYSVAPDLARLLIIPKIKVKARVTQVGVDKSNRLQAPINIYDAGWYTGSAKPAQKGAVVIDGHVHGPTKPGVFAELGQLGTGDVIKIEKGNHKIVSYKVVKTKVYDVEHVDMSAVMTSVSTKLNGLNLITCTGPLDAKTDSYTQRLVVFAVQNS
jgi:sortase (surface protein transpeptidase)